MKISILVAAPCLWLWTHIFLPQSHGKRAKKIVKMPAKEARKKINIYATLLILPYVFFLQTVRCQDYVDIIKFNYTYTSLNAFENSNAKTTIAEINLEATVPVVLNNRTTFVTGLYSEAFRVKLNADDLSKNIYGISPKVGVNLKHGEKWSGTYLILPRVASDFIDVSANDFQIGGIVLLTFTQKPNLNYKFGVYANSEFFGPWIVPLLGLYFINDSKKFETNLTLPFAADVNYRVGKKITTGINFTGITRSYHVTLTSVQDQSGYLARATSELFGYAAFNLSNSILLQTKVGHSFGRYYRVFDEEDQVRMGMPLVFFNDKRTQLNSDFADGWIFQVMAIYRFATASK